MKLSPDSTEAYAYLQGYLVKEVLKQYKKLTIKKKKKEANK